MLKMSTLCDEETSTDANRLASSSEHLFLPVVQSSCAKHQHSPGSPASCTANWANS